MNADPSPASETTGWSAPDVVQYYSAHRRRLEDLYPSERRFFDTLVEGSRSILDIGCAAGGMAEIVRSVSPGMAYCGVDISSRLIEIARQTCPWADFQVIDGENLPFADAAFDSALSLGVLHMARAWKTLLAEARRVSRRSLLFDLRLHGGADTLVGRQRLMFSGKWDGVSEAPYIVLGTRDLRGVLEEIARGGRLSAYGYWHDISPMTEAPLSRACMAVFLVENGKGRPGDRCVELPDEFRRVLC